MGEVVNKTNGALLGRDLLRNMVETIRLTGLMLYKAYSLYGKAHSACLIERCMMQTGKRKWTNGYHMLNLMQH